MEHDKMSSAEQESEAPLLDVHVRRVSSSNVSRDRIAEADSAFQKVSWRVVPVVFLMAFLSYVDRVNLSFISSLILDDLHLSNADYGAGSGLFFVTYALSQIPSNRFLKEVGAPIWFGVLLIGWGACASMTALISSRAHFFVSRLCLGFFEGGTFPGILYYLGLFYPKARSSFPIGLANSGTVVGMCLSGLLTAFILSLTGPASKAGWRWVLFLEGIPAMVLGVVAIFWLPKGPNEVKFLTASEKDAFATELAQERPPSFENSGGSSVGSILGNKSLWILIVGLILGNFSVVMGVIWAPLILSSLEALNGVDVEKYGVHSHSVSRTALLMTVPSFLGAVGMIVMGWSSSHFRERKYHAALSVSFGGICLSLIPWGAEFGLGFILICLAFLGIAGFTGPINSLQISYMTNENMGFGVAWVSTIVGSFGFGTAILLGWLIEISESFEPALHLCGVFSVISAGIYSLLKDEVA